MTVTGSIDETGSVESTFIISASIDNFSGQLEPNTIIDGDIGNFDGLFIDNKIPIQEEEDGEPVQLEGSFIPISAGDVVVRIERIIRDGDKEIIDKVIEELIGDGKPLTKSAYLYIDDGQPAITYDEDWNS